MWLEIRHPQRCLFFVFIVYLIMFWWKAVTQTCDALFAEADLATREVVQMTDGEEDEDLKL